MTKNLKRFDVRERLRKVNQKCEQTGQTVVTISLYSLTPTSAKPTFSQMTEDIEVGVLLELSRGRTNNGTNRSPNGIDSAQNYQTEAWC